MEKSINKVELDGFIGIEPEVKTLTNGNKLMRFSLATKENYKNKKGEWVTNTTWHTIVVWSKLAEKAETELKKGSRVNVEGKIANRQYTDKQGITRYISEIVASKYAVPSAE